MTCKQVTKTEKVHGKKKKVQKQSCTGKRVSGSFKLTTKALLRLRPRRQGPLHAHTVARIEGHQPDCALGSVSI